MEDKRDSYALFQMVSNLTGWQYKEMIMRLLIDFLLWAEPDIHPEWARRMACENWNQESGIGSIHIKGQYIGCLKMYLFDENPPSNYSNTPKCIVFRDHYSKSDVERVYLVADAFEEFLKERRIKHIRRNRERN